MFIKYQISECQTLLKDVLYELECKIAEYADSIYNRNAYLIPYNTDCRKIKDLLYYKNILTKLSINNMWIEDWKKIVANIKSLI